jgi:hypothetical protein
MINLRITCHCRRLFGRRCVDGQADVQKNQHNERKHVSTRHRQPDAGKGSGPSKK